MMPNEIQISYSVTDMQQMAASVAKSRLFGMDEAQAFTLMLLAQSEGIHPVKAVQRYHIVQGRPAMKADAMLADFQRIGGTVEWVTESDDREMCEAVFRHPIHAPGGKTVRFSMKDAKDAKLADKDVWKQYPASMMRARVTSIGIRMIAPGIVAGLYTPEEVGDFTKPIEVEARPVPEHYAINHDNQTGHGSGAYAEPKTVEAYQEFVSATVNEINAKWLDSLTDKATGEMLSADGQIIDTWQLSGHLLKWARSMDWVKAPEGAKAGQRDRFAAVAWEGHMAEFDTEARRYCRVLWVGARKKIKAPKPSERRDGELAGLADQDAVLDGLATSEAGSRG